MDEFTFEKIAEFICGDDTELAPIYRTGGELTRFFHRVGLTRFTHDGSTRKWWTKGILMSLNSKEIEQVICRLASPKEYGGEKDKVIKAIESLNKILVVEGLQVVIKGVVPEIVKGSSFTIEEEQKLRPLPPPDFYSLGIESSIADILMNRWTEAEKCVKAEAHLAAIIIMGSLLEGLLLSVLQRNPREANQSSAAPKDLNGKAKKFHEWKLSDMIDVAHVEKWVDLDVKYFSHALRIFRNLVHPYEQLMLQVFPDEDTSNICWLVVQAAVNDLAKILSRVQVK